MIARNRAKEKRAAKMFAKMVNKVFFGDLMATLDYHFDRVMVKELVKHHDQKKRVIAIPFSAFESCPIKMNLNAKRALKEIHSYFWNGIFPYEQI